MQNALGSSPMDVTQQKQNEAMHAQMLDAWQQSLVHIAPGMATDQVWRLAWSEQCSTVWIDNACGAEQSCILQRMKDKLLIN